MTDATGTQATRAKRARVTGRLTSIFSDGVGRAWLLVLPAVVLIAIFYAFPVLRVLWMSFSVPRPGLQNYELLATSPTVATVILVTLRISLVCTVVTVVLGYLVAYVLTHVSDRQRQYLLFFVALPFWLSVLVRTFAWMALLGREGPINNVLLALGVISEPLTMVRNEVGVVIGMVHYMLPFATFSLYANMAGIDRRLIMAARGLGVSATGAFLRVFLPLSIPGIIGASVLVLVLSLGFYVTPAILGGGKTVMLAEYIGFNVLQNVRWGLATMLASVLLVTIAAILFLLSRVFDIRRLYGAG
jgi:putative spermidine/putrescine transport system permease protein